MEIGEEQLCPADARQIIAVIVFMTSISPDLGQIFFSA
jgi:hypothetical protein